MDSNSSLAFRGVVKCRGCGCGCGCSLVASCSDPWIRTVKRKYREMKEGNRFFLPGFDPYSNAKILAENECIALREALRSQHKTIEDLNAELEEERNAASSAANETMSMLLRLQREKAEIQMEARQFKSFAEEKMSHDQEKIEALETLLYEKEQAIEALTYEVEACRHRMLSYGFTEAEMHGGRRGFSRNSSLIGIDAQYDVYAHDCTSIRCNVNDNPSASEGNVEVAAMEEFQYLRSPREEEHRISQSECDGEDFVKQVIVGQSPRWQGHTHKLSTDSFGSNSPFETEIDMKKTLFMESPKSTTTISSKKMESVHTGDRVYTIDSVHVGDYSNSSRCKVSYVNHEGVNEANIETLYMRLQALEVDKESLRQVILAMQKDKTQLVLLKEIAQHLSDRRMHTGKMPFLGAFSITKVFKWITSLVARKRRANQRKYVYGVSANNMGLLMLLDKGSQTRAWRCLTSSQV